MPLYFFANSAVAHNGQSWPLCSVWHFAVGESYLLTTGLMFGYQKLIIRARFFFGWAGISKWWHIQIFCFFNFLSGFSLTDSSLQRWKPILKGFNIKMNQTRYFSSFVLRKIRNFLFCRFANYKSTKFRNFSNFMVCYFMDSLIQILLYLWGYTWDEMAKIILHGKDDIYNLIPLPRPYMALTLTV